MTLYELIILEYTQYLKKYGIFLNISLCIADKKYIKNYNVARY